MKVPIYYRGEVAAYAEVDAEDYELVSQHKWYLNVSHGIRYAVGRNSRRNLAMHRLILGCAPGAYCDHIDGDGLNNRRVNLRTVTNAENHQNTRAHRDAVSPYRGVSFCKQTGRWKARVCHNGRDYWAGRHTTELAAAKAALALRRAMFPFAIESFTR